MFSFWGNIDGESWEKLWVFIYTLRFWGGGHPIHLTAPQFLVCVFNGFGAIFTGILRNIRRTLLQTLSVLSRHMLRFWGNMGVWRGFLRAVRRRTPSSSSCAAVFSLHVTFLCQLWCSTEEDYLFWGTAVLSKHPTFSWQYECLTRILERSQNEFTVCVLGFSCNQGSTGNIIKSQEKRALPWLRGSF